MNALAVFKGKNIRRTLYKEEWWFSIIDVVEALTESDRGRKYWSDLKTKLQSEGYYEVSEKIGQLKLESSDGKKYETDCATAKTLFRIIQSIEHLRPPLEGGHAHFFSERGGVSMKQQRFYWHPSRLATLGCPPGSGRAGHLASRNGGKIAGDARNQLEKQTGRRVVSKQTYLPARRKVK